MTDNGSTAARRPGSRVAGVCAWVLVICLTTAGTAAPPGAGPGPQGAPARAVNAAAPDPDGDQDGDKAGRGAEPSTWLLLAAGLAALLVLHQRRRPRAQLAEFPQGKINHA